MCPRAAATRRQLAANIAAAQSLEQLQVLVNRHAHQMNASLFAKVIQKAPNVSFIGCSCA
jgi:hypothetical protein